MIGKYGIKLSGLKMESVDFWGISALLGILGEGLCKRMFVLRRCHCGAVLGAKKKKYLLGESLARSFWCGFTLSAKQKVN